MFCCEPDWLSPWGIIGPMELDLRRGVEGLDVDDVGVGSLALLGVEELSSG